MVYHRKRNPGTRQRTTTDVIKGTRICYSCKKEKRLDEFGRNKNNRAFMGRSHECRTCHNKRSRLSKGRPETRFSTYKASAKIRGISFTISFAEFMSFWDTPCYYCDSEVRGIGLDRVDSKKGYSPTNVRSCCPECNYSKGKMTTDQFIGMCTKVAFKFKNHVVLRAA